MNYEEIDKCYEGETEEHANTAFEFGIQNDLYYQLFIVMTGIELFILIGGGYALYTVGMAIASQLDYREVNRRRK